MSKNEAIDAGHVIIIVNSIRPYAYEVNNILGLPEGCLYRFRFRHHWMPTVDHSSSLENHDGLVVLRNFETAQFLPLRRIHVTNILEVGDVSYIEYRLESIIDFDSDESGRAQQLQDFNERMKPAIRGYDNPPGGNLEKLIFMYSDVAYGIRDNHYEGDEENREFNSWGNLIELLGELDCYTDYDFLKLVEIVNSEGEQTSIVDHPYPDSARYRLNSDTIYRARLFQMAFTRREGDSSVIASRRIVLRGEPRVVDEIRTIQHVAGKYDLYNFTFKTGSTSRTRHSSLYLEVIRSDEIELPVLEVPISIVVRNLQKVVWLVSFVFFVVGVLLLFGSDQLTNFTEQQRQLVERVGILIAIISGTGLGPAAKSILERIGLEYQL